MARSAAQRVCLSCRRVILIGAHSRDCEFCGALIERCPECRLPVSTSGQQRCYSCNASLAGAGQQSASKSLIPVDPQPGEVAAASPPGRPASEPRSDWGLVAAVALVAALILAVYGIGANWQGSGGGDQVGGDSRAACLHAEGYRSDLATPDQVAMNQRALDACRP